MTTDIHITVHPDLHAVVLQPRGPFSLAAALSWGPALDQHPDTRSGMHQVVDLSAVEPGDPSPQEVRQLVEHLRATNPPQKFRVAYVAPTDLVFGMTRMFSILSETAMPRQREVFRNLPDALAWIASAG